jgi:transcriptional regulator GlxA family with amidase domain
MARILRFQHALALIRCPSRVSLAEIAQAAGYADQSHMTAEFRDIAGLTPSGTRPPPPLRQSPIPTRRCLAPGASFGLASCKEKT